MRRRKAERPICGCEHDLAYHEPDGDGGGSVCHATERHHIGSDRNGMSRYEMVRCSCQQYTGPRIIDPGYIARALPVDPRLTS